MNNNDNPIFVIKDITIKDIRPLSFRRFSYILSLVISLLLKGQHTMLVSQAFDSYIQCQKSYRAPATLASRGSLLRHWMIPQLGERDIRDIKSADIEDIYDQMEAHELKANTLFGAYAAIRSFFLYAQESGFIDDNPATQTRKYARQPKSPKEADAN